MPLQVVGLLYVRGFAREQSHLNKGSPEGETFLSQVNNDGGAARQPRGSQQTVRLYRGLPDESRVRGVEYEPLAGYYVRSNWSEETSLGRAR